MKNLFYFALLLSIFTFINCKNEKLPIDKTTVLIGEVVERPYSKKLSLITKDGDFRVNPTEIKIIDGKFQHTIISNHIQEYLMAFNDELEQGAWRNLDFFNDNDTIFITLFEKDKADNNIFYGGKLNLKKNTISKKAKVKFWDKIRLIYKTKVDSLEKLGKWETKEVQELWKKYDNSKDKTALLKKYNILKEQKKDLTEEGRFWQNKIDSLVSETKKMNYKFIEKDSSVLGYAMLMDELYSNKYNKDFNYGTIKFNLNKYQSKFKNHPYTASSNLLLEGIENAKIGSDYVDFSSKTKNDEIVKISPVIQENIVTLIDLWAPWCGPCIAKSKKLKPEYPSLKAKGLEVFAVIGGIDSKDKYKKNRDKYNYPWRVNYELNEEFNIWNKYNISRSGGSQFLVSSKGKILAINPEPKKIDSILAAIKSIKL